MLGITATLILTFLIGVAQPSINNTSHFIKFNLNSLRLCRGANSVENEVGGVWKIEK